MTRKFFNSKMRTGQELVDQLKLERKSKALAQQTIRKMTENEVEIQDLPKEWFADEVLAEDVMVTEVMAEEYIDDEHNNVDVCCCNGLTKMVAGIPYCSKCGLLQIN